MFSYKSILMLLFIEIINDFLKSRINFLLSHTNLKLILCFPSLQPLQFLNACPSFKNHLKLYLLLAVAPLNLPF